MKKIGVKSSNQFDMQLFNVEIIAFYLPVVF